MGSRPPILAVLPAALVACSCSPSSGRIHERATAAPAPGQQLATFAGGCFWCMEPPFEKLDGVASVTPGYTGGAVTNPTYRQVSGGKTGHTEAVQVVFNPNVIAYEDLLQVFWRSFDPTDGGGQFADRGSQYRPGIFFHDPTQEQAARRSKQALATSKRFGDRPIAVEITAYSRFYPAEENHQDYYKKNPARYDQYRRDSGRAGFLQKAWGKDLHWKPKPPYSRPDASAIRTRLDALQYKVTQERGTEPPFRNRYWNHKAPGIYVDVVSGEPLFSSADKFDSGSGWPSFTRPLEPANVLETVDRSAGMARTEVRSRFGASHLGHLFEDGPAPTGKRYCINSAALRFVPAEHLEREGYGRFRAAFPRAR